MTRSNDLEKYEPNKSASFELFREKILSFGAQEDIYSWAANGHGRIPRLIRVLHNFDPTGVASAIDQLLSEKVSQREQDNILHVIYNLAIRIWEIEKSISPELPEDKFKYLYYVYEFSETDRYKRVEPDALKDKLEVPIEKILSIGDYLEDSKLIEFETWDIGIYILHEGIRRVEAGIYGNIRCPSYVSGEEIKKVENRIRIRFAALKCLHERTNGNAFMKVQQTDLAKWIGIEHDHLIHKTLPYMRDEGWVTRITNTSLTISEKGIDEARALFPQ